MQSTRKASIKKHLGTWVVSGCKGMDFTEFSSICGQIVSDLACPAEIWIEGLPLKAIQLNPKAAGFRSLWMEVC